MEQRTLELELVSAKDLKDVYLFSKMDVYAIVSLDGDAYHGKQETKTEVVRACGTNPTFNFPMRFTVYDTLTQQNRLTLQVKLVCECSPDDKDIGVVYVPVKELFDSADPKNMKFTRYQVRRPSGNPKGELSFSYKFGEKVSAPVPVPAYQVGGPSTPAYGAYQLQATSSSRCTSTRVWIPATAAWGWIPGSASTGLRVPTAATRLLVPAAAARVPLPTAAAGLRVPAAAARVRLPTAAAGLRVPAGAATRKQV